jgi:trk system potassium uptake protein TrkH
VKQKKKKNVKLRRSFKIRFKRRGMWAGSFAGNSRGLLIVFLAWAAACLLGALPYYCTGFIPNFTDAVFESVSGFTTTGATVLLDIEALPRPLIFWRALTHWLGGMGIVVLTVALLPLLGAGGFQLVKAESSGPDKEKIAPRITLNVRILWLVYLALTTAQALLLFCFGMDWFDAIVHAFSTMATGGFSSRNDSIAYYNSPAIEWICTAFMLLAGFNFSLTWQALRGNFRSVIRNSEARVYAAIVLISGVIITLAILPQSASIGTALRQAFFNTATIITSTGLFNENYNVWPALAQGILFFLMFLGGCSGSTSGGIKIIRYVILAKQTSNEMKKIVYPKGVFNIQLDGKSGKKDVVYGVAGFVFSARFFCGAVGEYCGRGHFYLAEHGAALRGKHRSGTGKNGAVQRVPRFSRVC